MHLSIFLFQEWLAMHMKMQHECGNVLREEVVTCGNTVYSQVLLRILRECARKFCYAKYAEEDLMEQWWK